jgi:outer membrane protein
MKSRCDVIFGAAVVVLATLASGCHVDQSQEVATYRKVIDIDATTRPDAAHGPLTLRDALLLANQHNETLAAEGEVYLRSMIARRRTVANFLPTVNLVTSYVRRDPASEGGGDDDDDDDGGGGSSSRDHTLDVSADLRWNVFNGFRDVHRYWSDTFLIERRRNVLLEGQELLLLDVAQVYYQILRSEASVRVLENSLAVQEERLGDTRARLEAGMARPLDLAQTEAQVSLTRTILINARRDVRNARGLLALLTGSPALVDPAIALTDAFDLPSQVRPMHAHIETAAFTRKDLVAAEAAVNAARHDVDVAFGQYYPSVSIDFSAYLYRESSPSERDWDGLLLANIPLFAAGRIHADVREAWSFFRQALLVRSFLRRQVEQQVREAYHDLSASEARLAEQQVRLAAARQAFLQSDASYRVGLARNLERVAAQDALLDAQLQLASEEYDRKVFYLRLLRATGLLRQELERMFSLSEGPGAPTSQEDQDADGSLPLRPVTRPSE